MNFFYERQNARGNWLSSQIDVGYIERVAYVSSVQSARASAMDVRFTSARQLSLIYCASGDAFSRSIRRIYSFRPSVGADSDKILKKSVRAALLRILQSGHIKNIHLHRWKHKTVKLCSGKSEMGNCIFHFFQILAPSIHLQVHNSFCFICLFYFTSLCFRF